MRNAEQAISEQLDKLCNDEISLQSLLQNDEQFLVYMTHMVDELYNKTVKFVPKCNLDEMIVTLKLRESVFEKISDALSESHEL
jgi:alpha-D-ribose 1-methylphosphonate 5-triphosphate synthase subunit PhnI